MRERRLSLIGKLVLQFHIMGHVVDALDQVRKQEHKALTQAGDTTLTSASTSG